MAKERTKEASQKSSMETASGARMAMWWRIVRRRLMRSHKDPGRREGPIRSQRAKAKEAQARRDHHPLMSGRMVKTISHLVRKPVRRFQVSSSVLSADMKGTTDDTGKPGKRCGDRRSVGGRPTRVETFGPVLSR